MVIYVRSNWTNLILSLVHGSRFGRSSLGETMKANRTQARSLSIRKPNTAQTSSLLSFPPDLWLLPPLKDCLICSSPASRNHPLPAAHLSSLSPPTIFPSLSLSSSLVRLAGRAAPWPLSPSRRRHSLPLSPHSTTSSRPAILVIRPCVLALSLSLRAHFIVDCPVNPFLSPDLSPPPRYSRNDDVP